MMERYEIFVSARDAEALATMLSAHRRANALEADASDELADLLMEARLVPPERLPRDRVALHSTATYEEQPSGKRRTVTLVMPENADSAKARISVLSPIGLALIGRQRGSVVKAATPNGKRLIGNDRAPGCPTRGSTERANRMKQRLELRRDAAQLRAMDFGQSFEQAVAFRCEPQVDFAAVLRCGLARDKSLAHEPVDKSDRAVVTHQQLLREVVDRDAFTLGAGAHDEQRLVVLRGEAALLRLGFRKAQELAQRAPERGELLVLVRAQFGHKFQRALADPGMLDTIS